MIIVTTDTLPGHAIRRVIGVVDIGVYKPPPRSVLDQPTVGNAGAMRTEAWQKLGEHATNLGANAIVGFRFETLVESSSQHLGSVFAVLAYGTAVVAEPID